MFKFISLDYERDGYYYYWIIDDDFYYQTSIQIPHFLNGVCDRRCLRPIVLAREYQKRNLPVAKNIAYYYNNYFGTKFSKINLMEDLKMIDRCYVNSDFRTKYYPCVLRILEEWAAVV